MKKWNKDNYLEKSKEKFNKCAAQKTIKRNLSTVTKHPKRKQRDTAIYKHINKYKLPLIIWIITLR